MGPARKALEIAGVNPPALFVKTKRRLSYTNRFKAQIVRFWLQPIDTNHRSGHRTLQEVAEHTKILFQPLNDWTRKKNMDKIFRAEAALRSVRREIAK
jgi:transposase-like protein